MLDSRKQKILLILTMLISAMQIAIAQEDCSLKKEKDGIKVYSCKSTSESLNVVRAEFDLYASVDQYLELVRNINNYKNWHFRILEPKELKRKSENNIIYYTQISAPWPISNRDLILDLKLKQEADGSLLVTLKSLPEYLPQNNDFVRIPYSYSEMRMSPVANNHLKVSYWIKADPGGSIPDWVTNMVSTQGPYETFKKMKDILESVEDSSSPEYSVTDTTGQR